MEFQGSYTKPEDFSQEMLARDQAENYTPYKLFDGSDHNFRRLNLIVRLSTVRKVPCSTTD